MWQYGVKSHGARKASSNGSVRKIYIHLHLKIWVFLGIV